MAGKTGQGTIIKHNQEDTGRRADLGVNTPRQAYGWMGVYACSHRVEVDSIILLRQCMELLFIQGLGLLHQGYIFRAADQQAGHQQDRKERSRDSWWECPPSEPTPQ